MKATAFRRTILGLTMLIAGAMAWATGVDDGAGISEAHAQGARAWLGVALKSGPGGAVVASHVIRTSPAEKGGLEDGDQIVSADGNPIDTPADLVRQVSGLPPGKTLNVRIRRGGVERDLPVVLVAHPGSDAVLRLDKVGTAAPSWPQEATVVAGVVPKSLGGLQGRVVLVDFWASWCGPCRMIAPELSKLHDEFGAQGLTVVGITSDSEKIAASASRALKIRYPVVSDRRDETGALYGVQAIPTMFVVDKQGTIREVFVGFEPGKTDALRKLITKLLAEPAPPKKP